MWTDVAVPGGVSAQAGPRRCVTLAVRHAVAIEGDAVVAGVDDGDVNKVRRPGRLLRRLLVARPAEELAAGLTLEEALV